MAQFYQVAPLLRSYHLAASQGAQLYIEEYGNAKGLPLLFCYDGPGTGKDLSACQLFNSENYRLIVIDQRGCGLSTPQHDISINTTALLIEDMELVRQSLGIKQWALVGYGWGAALVFCYMQSYADRVSGAMLLSALLPQFQDVKKLFSVIGTGAQCYPEAFAKLNQLISAPIPVLPGYQQLLYSENELMANKAARSWHDWLNRLKGIQHNQSCNNTHLLNEARLSHHFFINHCFIERKARLNLSADFPVYLVHGRKNLFANFAAVYHFSQSLSAENLQMYIINQAEHQLIQPQYAAGLLKLADQFYQVLKTRHNNGSL